MLPSFKEAPPPSPPLRTLCPSSSFTTLVCPQLLPFHLLDSISHLFKSVCTSLTCWLPWHLWSRNMSPEAALFVIGDYLRFEWGLDAFDVSCLPDRSLTVISRLGISSANSMSLQHIITLRSTGSLLTELTFTRSLVLSAVSFRSPFIQFGSETDRQLPHRRNINWNKIWISKMHRRWTSNTSIEKSIFDKTWELDFPKYVS